MLAPRGAAVLTRTNESPEQYVSRITATVDRMTRPLPDQATVVIAGLPIGAAGPRVRGDLARLREVHQALHQRLPDAIVVTPTVGEGSTYPRPLIRRPAPTWLRQANQHPKGDRRPLRAAWDATQRHLEAVPSPAPPAHLGNLPDRVGSAPGVSAGQPVGGDAPAGAEPSPRGDVPTRPSRSAEVAGAGFQPAEPQPKAGPLVPPALARELAALRKLVRRRHREHTLARQPLARALDAAATEAIAEVTRRGHHQRLPKRLSATERWDPRVLPPATVDACQVEDLAYRRPWLLRHVRLGLGGMRLLELDHGTWRHVSLMETQRLPTLHRDRPKVLVLRGRREPTRLTLAALTLLGLAVGGAGVAVAVVWPGMVLLVLVLVATAVVVALARLRQR